MKLEFGFTSELTNTRFAPSSIDPLDDLGRLLCLSISLKFLLTLDKRCIILYTNV
jgi:hypothetical protein